MITPTTTSTVSDASTPQVESKTLNHTERHKDHSDVLRDAIIGFADGLTVPFALTAGLTASVPPILIKEVLANTAQRWLFAYRHNRRHCRALRGRHKHGSRRMARCQNRSQALRG